MHQGENTKTPLSKPWGLTLEAVVVSEAGVQPRTLHLSRAILEEIEQLIKNMVEYKNNNSKLSFTNKLD